MNPKKKFSIPVSKKVKRIVFWTVGIIVGLYLLLLTGLSIYVSSSKERLIGFLNAKMKETILGELKVDKADIIIWRTFPSIGLTLQNVSISDSFYHKPFIKAGEITAKVGFLGLIGNKIKISSVEVKDALIHTFTDANGYTNSYVLRPQNKSKRKSKKPVILSNLELENVTIVIEDAIRKKRYAARIDDADIDMRLTGNKYRIAFDEDLFLRGLGFKIVQGYWLENQRIQAKWKLEFDTSTHTLSFKDTKVKIQGQPFVINGEFVFGENGHFALNATTKDIPFKNALGMVKPNVRNKIEKLNLQQPLDVKVKLIGPLSKPGDPNVDVEFATKENNIVTPALELDNCNFSGSYRNQVNPGIEPDDSNSRVSLTGFTGDWGSIHLKAKDIAISNLRKPVIQFQFASECTMPQLDEQLGSSAIHFLEGNAQLYLAYNGPLVNDASFLNAVDAKIKIVNGKVVYVPRNLTFSECNGLVDLSGNNLNVNNLECNLNTNHFVVNINGTNLNRMGTSQPGKATINCSVFTPALNLSDFAGLFSKKASTVKKKGNKSLSHTVDAIDNAVENGNVGINLKAQQVALRNFKASNVTADILFTDNDWEVRKAYLQHADGTFNLSAKIHQTNDALNYATMQLDLAHMNVKKLFYAFDNFGQTSITSSNINGVIDVKANIATNINSAGKLQSSTLNGKASFSLKNASLVNFKPFLEVQKYIFKNRDLNNIKFAELKNTFDINKGDIYINRMPIISSAMVMYVEGVYSFGNKTDISIQVPFSSLKDSPDDYKEVERNGKTGSSVYLRAKDNGEGGVKIGLDAFRFLRSNKKRNKDKDD